MTDQIVYAGIDTGNGGTNVAVQLNGKAKFFYSPSVRAAATGNTLGLKDLELDYEYVDWNGNRYVVGDDVTRVSKRGLSRHTGINRYGSEFHQFMTAYALRKAGVKGGVISALLNIPPGMYKDGAKFMQEQYGKATVEIQLKSDKKPAKWNYINASVLPEGVASLGAFLFDKQGQMVANDLFVGDIAIIDIGVHTVDLVWVSNGKLNFEALNFATKESAGIDTHIRKPILDDLYSLNDDFRVLTVDDIDMVIRRGLDSGNWQIQSGSKVVDLQPHIEKRINDYSYWIADNIIDGDLGSLRGLKGAVLVGGGAVLTEAILREWYKDKIVDRRKHATAATVSPLWLNAYGSLLFLLNKAARG